jgi:sigma-B regulation protein RsbU (phosphoserine phosphatase)
MPADSDLPSAGERQGVTRPDPTSRHAPRGTQSAGRRERQARLSDARERVNRALTEEFDQHSIMTNLLREAMIALGADSGVVAVLERGGLEPRRAVGLPIGAESAAIDVDEQTTPHLWQVLNGDEPSWHGQTDTPDSPLAPLLGDRLGRVTLLIPLIHARRPMGAVLLTYHDHKRSLLPDEVAFARKIGAATSIAIVNARLYQDQRRIATTLQSGFIHPLPAIDGLELGTVSRRAYEPDLIGGDFADVFLLPDRRVLIMSGDVSGHGVRSATLAEGVRSGIRALALTGLSPGRILETMNELLILQEQQERFVTTYLALLDVNSGEMIVSCAGHHPPARMNKHGVGLLRTDQGVPLGSFRLPFEETKLRLDPGETMVFYTDGIVEARKGDEMFGHRRLLRALNGLRDNGATAIAAGVRDAAERFAGELTDDIQVLTLRLSRPHE